MVLDLTYRSDFSLILDLQHGSRKSVEKRIKSEAKCEHFWDRNISVSESIYVNTTCAINLNNSSFTYKIFKKGIKKELNEEDVYEILKDYRAKRMGDKLEKEWKRELKRSKDPSVFRMMIRCFGKTYIMYGFLQLIMKTILM